jgi:5'-3' exoribonuclease 2
MNQQRSRRFRAAMDARIKRETEAQIRKERGEQDPEEDKKQAFDSNCITPGTPFMAKIAHYLKYYIAERLTNDPGWKNV